MKCLMSLACGVALLTLTSVPADAKPLHYTLSGIDVNNNGELEFADFYIDSQPTVLAGNAGLGSNFRVKFISGIFQYGATVKTLQDVAFFNGDFGGGFVTLDTNIKGDDPDITFLLNVVGSQLYTGPEDMPTLLTGDFDLFDTYDGSPISLSVIAVPEPATWAMMIAGFGAVGFALRRRNAVRTAVSYA